MLGTEEDRVPTFNEVADMVNTPHYGEHSLRDAYNIRILKKWQEANNITIVTQDPDLPFLSSYQVRRFEERAIFLSHELAKGCSIEESTLDTYKELVKSTQLQGYYYNEKYDMWRDVHGYDWYRPQWDNKSAKWVAERLDPEDYYYAIANASGWGNNAITSEERYAHSRYRSAKERREKEEMGQEYNMYDGKYYYPWEREYDWKYDRISQASQDRLRDEWLEDNPDWVEKHPYWKDKV